MTGSTAACLKGASPKPSTRLPRHARPFHHRNEGFKKLAAVLGPQAVKNPPNTLKTKGKYNAAQYHVAACMTSANLKMLFLVRNKQMKCYLLSANKD